MMKETSIRDRHTIFRAMEEIERGGFAWRAPMIWEKTGGRSVSLWRVCGPVEKLPALAQQYGYALVREKRTTPSVRSSRSPSLRKHRATAVRKNSTALMGKNHTNNSLHRNLQNRNDDHPHTRIEQLRSNYPNVSLERLRWAVSLVESRAKTPPRSPTYFHRALPSVFGNLEAERDGWLAQIAFIQLHENRCLDRPSLAEDLKCACVQNDLPYSSEVVWDAIQAAERRLDVLRQARSELRVGSCPERLR